MHWWFLVVLNFWLDLWVCVEYSYFFWLWIVGWIVCSDQVQIVGSYSSSLLTVNTRAWYVACLGIASCISVTSLDGFDTTLQEPHDERRRQRQKLVGFLPKIRRDIATSAQSVRPYSHFARIWHAMSERFMAIQTQRDSPWASGYFWWLLVGLYRIDSEHYSLVQLFGQLQIWMQMVAEKPTRAQIPVGLLFSHIMMYAYCDKKI